ncbi:hypothetical protein NF701_08390 [Sphingomonadaceae bacterium OTU29THOMA1]|nr:hypothetical protein NF701_08390 [Sphingomonadaceae bacterium OTU29THOMA1]
MKIIVTAAPLIGHFNPALAAGRLLAELGHEVVGYGPSALRRNIEASGLRFQALPAPADVNISDIGRFFPERRAMPPGYATRRKAWERMFVERMDVEHRGLSDLVNGIRADLILAESMTFATLPFLLGPRSARPVIGHVGATFLQLSRDDRAPMFDGLPPAQNEVERQDYARRMTEATSEWFDPIDAFINRVLHDHGRPALPMPFYDAVVRLPDFFLQAGVPGLEFPRQDLPESLRFCGATPPTPGLFPIPAWAADLEDGRKVVLVTQGTVANGDFSQLIGPTLIALAEEPGLLVLAATGGRPVETLGPLPPNVRAAEYLPFDWLMPRVDLLVTNGGYGAVTQALSLGIPLVQAGTTEDKREVGARIAWSGTGIVLDTDRPTPEQIHAAVCQALQTPTYGERSRALATEFQSHDLRATLAPMLEALVHAQSPGAGNRASLIRENPQHVAGVA